MSSSARAITSPWASSSSWEPTGALAGTSIEYIRPWISSSARRSTPCRARRRPSARRTPRGNGTARQASEVGRSDPRAMHACSVTPESPCQHTECSGAELCRNPATGGEPSCHPLAARLVGSSSRSQSSHSAGASASASVANGERSGGYHMLGQRYVGEVWSDHREVYPHRCCR